jgi:hypothetical protein
MKTALASEATHRATDSGIRARVHRRLTQQGIKAEEAARHANNAHD